MCGIAGFFGSNSLPRHTRKASELLAHRGPDGSGIESCTSTSANGVQLSVEFAHRRLSIVDLSEQGKQPFKDRHGRLLIFNGEIFNWKALRRELETDGYKFISNTDTEVILAGYDRWGNEVFQRMNGFWALGLYDPRHSDGPRLVLSRDRCGIKPLYYMLVSDGYQYGIYFSSEIRSLLALRGAQPATIPHKVVEVIINGALARDGDTIYRDVYEFPISSYAIFNQNSNHLDVHTYWNLKDINRTINNEGIALEQFTELIEDSVDLWMHADVPVGLTLSSGIDSSVIAVAAARKGHRDVIAFSSHFPGSSFDEFELAGALAKQLGITHIPVTPKLDDLGPDLSNFSLHQETLFTSFSQFVAYCVYREIHKHGYKAFLAGQGGDELFLGYQRYLSSYIRNDTLLSESLLQRIISVHRHSNLSFAEIFGYLAYFSGKRIRGLRRRMRAKKIFVSQCVENVFAGSIDPMPSNLEAIQLSETLGNSQLRRLLRYDDRSASAFGLEGRPVLLDHRLIEFAFSLSPSLLIRKGWTKYILRKYLDRNGHSDIAWRKTKLGFPAPDTLWSDQWLKSNWQLARQQKVIKQMVHPNLNIAKLGGWEKLALTVVAMTANDMRWQ